MDFHGTNNNPNDGNNGNPSSPNGNFNNNDNMMQNNVLQLPETLLSGILRQYSNWDMNLTDSAEMPQAEIPNMFTGCYRPHPIARQTYRRSSGSSGSTPDCHSGCETNATTRCLDCNEFMCPECTIQHHNNPLNQNHAVVALPTPIGSSPTSNYAQSFIMPGHLCDLHNEVYRYVCENCEKLVCQCCTFCEHINHNYVAIASYIENGREKLEAAISSGRTGARVLKTTIDKALTLIRLIERNCVDVADNIRKSFRQFMIAIEDRERHWLEYVEKHRIRRLALLHDQMAGLKSTLAGLTEITDGFSKIRDNLEKTDEIDLAAKICAGRRQLEQFAAIHRDLQPRQEMLTFTTPDYTLLGEIRNQGAIGVIEERNTPYDPSTIMPAMPISTAAYQPYFSPRQRRPIVRDNGYNRLTTSTANYGTVFNNSFVDINPVPIGHGNVNVDFAPNYNPNLQVNTNVIGNILAVAETNPIPNANVNVGTDIPHVSSMTSNFSQRSIVPFNPSGPPDWDNPHVHTTPELQFGAPRVTQCIAGSTDHIKVRNSNCITLSFANEGHEDGQVSRPWGICVDKMGNIVISDRRNNRVQVFTPEGKFKFKFGRKGVGNAEFDLPAGICTDCDNRIIVVDKDNHRVQIFTANGVFLTKFGTFGKEYGQFQYPWDVAVNSRRQIVVTDSRNHRIQQFDSEGRFIRQIVFDNQGPGKSIAAPRGVCYTPHGNIIVSDFDNHCLYLIDPDVNEVISSKGSEGCGFQEFNRPSGLCCDDDGRIIVADSKNQRLMVFSPNMEYLWDIEIRPSVNPQMPRTLDERDRTCDVALMPDGRIVFLIELSPDSKEGSNPHKRFVHVY